MDSRFHPDPNLHEHPTTWQQLIGQRQAVSPPRQERHPMRTAGTLVTLLVVALIAIVLTAKAVSRQQGTTEADIAALQTVVASRSNPPQVQPTPTPVPSSHLQAVVNPNPPQPQQAATQAQAPTPTPVPPPPAVLVTPVVMTGAQASDPNGCTATPLNDGGASGQISVVAPQLVVGDVWASGGHEAVAIFTPGDWSPNPGTSVGAYWVYPDCPMGVVQIQAQQHAHDRGDQMVEPTTLFTKR